MTMCLPPALLFLNPLLMTFALKKKKKVYLTSHLLIYSLCPISSSSLPPLYPPLSPFLKHPFPPPSLGCLAWSCTIIHIIYFFYIPWLCHTLCLRLQGFCQSTGRKQHSSAPVHFPSAHTHVQSGTVLFF